MPDSKRRWRVHLPLYLVPIAVGMFGVLLSRELENPVMRGVIALLSVAVPVFAGGNLLARVRTGRIERVLLVGGVALLTLGAAVTVSGLSESLVEWELVPNQIGSLSRWLGVLSLLAGMTAVILSVVRAGEATEELGERFRQLAEQMGEGFVLTDPEGTVVLVNRRMCDLTGLPKDEMVGQRMGALAQRLEREPAAWTPVKQDSRGVVEREASWIVRDEERRFWIMGTAIYDARSRYAGDLYTVHDITEQHRMAKRLESYTQGLQQLVEDRTEKLRKSEERLRSLLLEMNEGFLTLSPSFQIRFANDRACRLLGVEDDALIGTEIFQYVEGGGRARLLSLLHSLRDEQPVRTRQEFDFVRSDGKRVPVMVAGAAVHGDETHGLQYSLVVTDVTELKEMQRQLEIRARELEAVNEELRAHDRAKDAFLSNVSHELRTPLSTIQGYVEMLDSEDLGPLEGPQLTALQVMSRNVARLKGMINELIEFSRMEIQGVELNYRVLSIKRLAQECIGAVRPGILAKDLSVSMHIEEGVSMAWGDHEKLGRALGNLLSNAVKFTDKGGMVQLRATRRGRNGLALSVTDTGIGIDKTHQERIFTKFFQVDGSLTRRYEGTGIGLTVVKSIAEAHGGSIELASAPGEGSTFTLVLPAALFEIQRHSPVDSVEGLPVLVCEESPDFRKALEDAVRHFGGIPYSVENGHACIRAVREKTPGLVIMDEVLPDIPGVTVAARLREQPAAEHTPIVALTPQTGSKSNWELAHAERVLFLSRPFSVDQLAATVRLALGAPPENEIEPAPHARFSALLVSADADMLAWMQTGLEHRSIRCFASIDADHALDVISAVRPGIVFVDIESAHTAVADTMKALANAAASHSIPLYILTEASPGQRRALKAAGCLPKPFSIADLTRAVEEAAHHGGVEGATPPHAPVLSEASTREC